MQANEKGCDTRHTAISHVLVYCVCFTMASSKASSSSSSVVKAESLVPNLFAASGGAGIASAADTLEYDLGNLMASDSSTVGKPGKDIPENTLRKLTTQKVQLLINAIWKLPVERTAEGPMVQDDVPTCAAFALSRSRLPALTHIIACRCNCQRARRSCLARSQSLSRGP